jgi:hypothetical protein
MVRPLKPTKNDVQNFALGGTTLGAAFSGYKQVTEPETVLVFITFGLISLFFRELGQRVIAHWMESEVELKLSKEGAVTTVFVAMFSYISVLSLVFLVPVSSSFSAKSYEHWGKSIDAIWAKRKYWLVSSGIVSLFCAWALAYSSGISNLAELISLFTFFQLLPLDEHKKICGKLDGAYIMLHTGFTWVIFMGITIILMILSVL